MYLGGEPAGVVGQRGRRRLQEEVDESARLGGVLLAASGGEVAGGVENGEGGSHLGGCLGVRTLVAAEREGYLLVVTTSFCRDGVFLCRRARSPVFSQKRKEKTVRTTDVHMPACHTHCIRGSTRLIRENEGVGQLGFKPVKGRTKCFESSVLRIN